MRMGIAAVGCRGQLGLAAPPVRVEVHLGPGLPSFLVVGLPATAVRESKDRVRAALASSGFEFPAGRITVSLAPADLPKEGGRFDLPIALGILLASGQVTPCGEACEVVAAGEFYGELSLNGDLLPVRGLVPPAAHAARERRVMVVPVANLAETRVVRHPRVWGARSLLEVCGRLNGSSAGDGFSASAADPAALASAATALMAADLPPPDLIDVRGQLQPKRALLIAAAGNHNLLLNGPPGSGKTMLAQRLAGLLPPLAGDEALEVAAIASVSASGFEPCRFGVRPFRAPHHSASVPAMVGGGAHARPGEVSLAHYGVLFLDELPEFGRHVLESLREPLENGHVVVSRVRLRSQYPARFQLVAAMNPCPCGYQGDAGGTCRCTPAQVERYRTKISGPLLDRIDLFVDVPRVPVLDLARQGTAAESALGALSSREAAGLVAQVRERQIRRRGCLNSVLAGRQLEACANLSPAARSLLADTFERLRLTARSWHRVLRVARTIADLEDSDAIEPQHAAEAVQLRRGVVGGRG